MDKNRKLGYVVLGGLCLATVAARAAYTPLVTARIKEPFTLPALGGNGFEPAPSHLPPGEKGEVRISAVADRGAVLRQGDNEVHVAVSVDTHGLGVSHRVPTDFVVVFDRSGSMAGEKIEYGKQALRELINRLGERDRFGLVAYDSDAEIRVPLRDEAHVARAEWLRAVNGLGIAGGTNISGGLDLGLAELREKRLGGRAARVLLLSDGLANEGETSLAALNQRAQRVNQSEAVLSTIGIGSDFDENVMTSLARAGTGAFYYLAKLQTLPVLLSAELKTAGETYAQSAELRVKLPRGVEFVRASNGSVSMDGDTAVVSLGSLYGDHTHKVWLTFKVPNDELRAHELGAISLRYRRNTKPFEVALVETPRVECVAEASVFEQSIVKSVWEEATVVEELAQRREQLGAAIRDGEAADVDGVVAQADRQRGLAERLGSARVLAELAKLRAEAAPAKAAQRAGGETRSMAAKNSVADGFGLRNSSSYKNVDAAYSR